MTPEPRQRTTSPSPLVAALAQAVIDVHATRAGLAREVGAMSGRASGEASR
jgi:hypothetical protein